MPNGKIQPEHSARLKEMGDWLAMHGESIYGTRGGPVTPRPWGVTTQKGNTVYVHVLDWQDQSLLVPLGGRTGEKRALREDRRQGRRAKRRRGRYPHDSPGGRGPVRYGDRVGM